MFQIEPLAFTTEAIRATLYERAAEQEYLNDFDPEDFLERGLYIEDASDVLNGLVSGTDYARTLDWTIVANSDSSIEGYQWGIVVGGVVFGGSFREGRSMRPGASGVEGMVEIVELIQAIVNYDIERVNVMIKNAA